MPFKEPGTQELLERVDRRTLTSRAADAAQARRDRADARHAGDVAHRDRHLATSAPCWTTCCRTCAQATCSCCAPPSRPARPSSWPATWRSSAASASARTSSSRTCPSGSPPTTSSRRSPRCRASSAASARPPASARPQLFEPLGRADRADHAGAGRAGEDLDQHPPLREVRAAEPADDGLRAYGANVFDVIELINRDYPRGGIADAGADRRHLPAQGLRVLRGALERARACCWPSRACTRRVPLFLVEGIKRRLGGSLRERRVAVLGLAFKARHRRPARLAVAQADPAARARAGRRRGRTTRVVATPTEPFEDAVSGADVVVVATNHSEYSTPDALPRSPSSHGGRLPGGRPVERARRRPGVRAVTRP